ncbi:MAG: DUF2092 domain-containing protein [Rhodospirillales bacterium]|nr:MAG: DUF2092 domain-containing protein [Rhodospirillales bacterium]
MSIRHLFCRSARSLTAAFGMAAVLVMASANAEEAKNDAEPAPMNAEEAQVDPEAARILKAMSDALAASEMLSGRATTLYEVVQPGGITHLREESILFFVRRPDALHVRTINDEGVHRYFWYDGQKLSRLIDAESGRQYTQIDVPDTLDAMLAYIADTYQQNMPLADFLYADPYGTFSEHLISGAYLGERTVRGKPAHHLLFESYGVDFEVWIAAEGPPVPLRFAINYVTEPGEPLFLAEFEQWNLEAYLDPGMFGFTPPEGAEEVPAARREE